MKPDRRTEPTETTELSVVVWCMHREKSFAMGFLLKAAIMRNRQVQKRKGWLSPSPLPLGTALLCFPAD